MSASAAKELIKSIGVDAVSIQKCYLPFYNVELKKGKSKMVDALGYSLEI